MSTKTSDKPHVLPLSVYFGVAITLLLMTGLTVEAASFDFGEWNVVIAMFIAIVKASLVALIFMHLFWDSKIYTVVFVSSLVFLGFFLTLTMFDTLQRDRIYAERNLPIVPAAIIYDATDSSKSESEAVVEDSTLEDTTVGVDTSAVEEDWSFE